MENVKELYDLAKPQQTLTRLATHVSGRVNAMKAAKPKIPTGALVTITARMALKERKKFFKWCTKERQRVAREEFQGMVQEGQDYLLTLDPKKAHLFKIEYDDFTVGLAISDIGYEDKVILVSCLCTPEDTYNHKWKDSIARGLLGDRLKRPPLHDHWSVMWLSKKSHPTTISKIEAFSSQLYSQILDQDENIPHCIKRCYAGRKKLYPNDRNNSAVTKLVFRRAYRAYTDDAPGAKKANKKEVDTSTTIIHSDAGIIDRYFAEWAEMMRGKNKVHLISKERCIQDWVRTNGAWEVKE